MEIVVASEEGNLSDHIWLVTSVELRAIKRNTSGQREMDQVVTQPRSLQMSLQDGLLRSLLFKIQKILKHSP